MKRPNTLFLLAKHGLKKGSEVGLLESWLWNLSAEDQEMEYISLHKSKSDRAYKGGTILGFRDASAEEVHEHQQLLDRLGKDQMKDTGARKIVIFKVDLNWKQIWPIAAKSHQMAYKSNWYIEINS